MRLGQIPIINWLNFAAFDFLRISARENPISPQRWQPLNCIDRHALITPWPARVVDAHWFVRLEVAVEIFGRREAYFAKRDADIGMDFAFDVDAF